MVAKERDRLSELEEEVKKLSVAVESANNTLGLVSEVIHTIINTQRMVLESFQEETRPV